MPVAYHIYANDGRGGPVDYSRPIGNTAALTFTTPALALSSDFTFAVRAYDVATGLEEANTAAVARTVVDAKGLDVTGLPKPPHAVAVVPTQDGACQVSWGHGPDSRYGAPAQFLVFLTPVGQAASGTPAAVVAFASGRVGYTAALPGPFTFGAYTAVVASANLAGPAPSSPTAPVVLGLSALPLSMETITARVVTSSP